MNGAGSAKRDLMDELVEAGAECYRWDPVRHKLVPYYPAPHIPPPAGGAPYFPDVPEKWPPYRTPTTSECAEQMVKDIGKARIDWFEQMDKVRAMRKEAPYQVLTDVSAGLSGIAARAGLIRARTQAHEVSALITELDAVRNKLVELKRTL